MTSLLPPNASALERAIETATAGVAFLPADVPHPILALWDPMTCPIAVLPWLAWGFSIDRWSTLWTEAEKRTAVARAIEDQRRKGTPASVRTVLESFDALLELVEWHQQSPRATPHTFEVRLPLGAAGGTRATAAFADAIIRDVARVKPARAHFELVQTIHAAGAIGVVGAGRVLRFDRHDAATRTDADPVWRQSAQTEDGEPFQTEAGLLIEDR